MKNIFTVYFFTQFFGIAWMSGGYSAHAQPKLVVGIVVDQMRYDYIQKYWNKFGDDGFKRLVNEGFSCNNTHYNYVPTLTGPGHASIFTGSTPSVHGIISNKWADKHTGKGINCVRDKSVSSVGGDSVAGQMSPRNLLSSTIGEGLKKKNGNLSRVIGIALKDRGAILPAGHNADAAYWYDDSNGNWITSTYYMKELPVWVTNFNQKQLAKKYLSQQWTTLLPLEKYVESDADNNECEELFEGKSAPVFPYDLPSLMKSNGELELIRTTPFGNSLTKDFALETIQNENLGKREGTDFISVSFSSTDNIGHQFGPQSVEVEDCYLRFDKDIADFLKFLDQWVDKKNVLVFLTADHGAGEAVQCLLKKNMPAGTLEAKTVADSLNRFFMRAYRDSLVLKVSDFAVYLDKKKIAEKKLSLEEIQQKAVSCLLKINGIADAVAAVDIQGNVFQDPIRSKVKAGFNPERGGDVVFVLKRGWLEGYSRGTSHGSPYAHDTHVPLIWWGYSIIHGMSEEPLSITQIAPTISSILKIPAPTGCESKPISFLLK